MGDPFQKVRSGQNVPALPAEAWNAFIDAALDFKKRHRVSPGGNQSFLQADIIQIRNDSGDDQDRFSILGVDKPVITPGEDLDSFRDGWALSCVVPTSSHLGKFVILLDPIADGEMGRAWAAGVTICQVLITAGDSGSASGSENDSFADVNSGDTTRLATATSGTCRILWKEGDGSLASDDSGGSGVGGTVWAVVRFGGGGGGTNNCHTINGHNVLDDPVDDATNDDYVWGIKNGCLCVFGITDECPGTGSGS